MSKIDIPERTPSKDLLRQVLELMEAKGIAHDLAPRLVIYEWLLKGDIRPLLEVGDVSDLVLGLIIRMLMRDPVLGYHLKLVRAPGRTGRPSNAGSQWRDLFIWAMYKADLRNGLSSADAYAAVMAHFGISKKDAERAVAAVSKPGMPPKPHPS
jgi:hypothetical protein